MNAMGGNDGKVNGTNGAVIRMAGIRKTYDTGKVRVEALPKR